MDFEKILKGVGYAVSAINPAVGSSVVALSSVAGALNDVDDNHLENVAGLSYVSKSLRDIVDKDKFDKDRILQIAKMIDDVSLILEKNLKLIK